MWTRFFKYTKRITESEYDRYYQSFRERQSELDTQLALLQEAEDTYYLSAKYLLELAQKAHQLFEVAEIDERRQLIKLVLSNLRLEGRKLRYEAIKPFKTILDFSDCQQWLPVPSHNIDEYIKRLLAVVERLGYGEGLSYLRYKPAMA